MDIFSFNWKNWEPFRTTFVLRTFDESTRSNIIDWDQHIADKVREVPNGANYAEAFANVAFGNETGKLTEQDVLALFVKFFWILHRREERGLTEAESLVYSYCKKFGLGTCPVGPLRQLWALDCQDLPDNPAANIAENEGTQAETVPCSISQSGTQQENVQAFNAGPTEVVNSSDNVHNPHTALSAISVAEINKHGIDPRNKLTGRYAKHKKVKPHQDHRSQSSLSATPPYEGGAMVVSSSTTRKRKAEQQSEIISDSNSTLIVLDKDGSGGSAHQTVARGQTSSAYPPLRKSPDLLPGEKQRSSTRRNTIHNRGAGPNAPNTHFVEKRQNKSRRISVATQDTRIVDSDPTRINDICSNLTTYSEYLGIDGGSANNSNFSAITPGRQPRHRATKKDVRLRKFSKGQSTNQVAASIQKAKKAVRSAAKGAKKRNSQQVNSSIVNEELATFSTGTAERAHAAVSDNSNNRLSSLAKLRTPQTDMRITVDNNPVGISSGYFAARGSNEGVSYGAPLNDITQALTPIQSNKPRPPLPVSPPIWAQSRQELCESCDFFKSYQGGVYYTKNFARGYLLGGFPALRDIFRENGKLIISHGGGKAASKGADAGDQSVVDYSIKALLNTRRTNQPIVLIADDQYAEFPFDLRRSGKEGYAYVVLGYYLIRDFWAERHPANNADGYVVRYKFAFQWCGPGEPWWARGAEPSVSGVIDLIPISTIQSAECNSCSKDSPHIYKQGWMCLNPSCVSFFQLGSNATIHTPLQYDGRFLQLQPLPVIPLPELCPVQPTTAPENGINTTPHFYRGWHCPCGRLSSRVKWGHWECPACEQTLATVGKIRTPKEFWGGPKIADYEHYLIGNMSEIVTDGEKLYNGIPGITLILPNNRGKIHMLFARPLFNAEANEIFEQYQIHASNGGLPFRRYPLKSHQCRGTLLTNYFSQNCGVPYQYVGGADRTLPFDQCPPCVIRARQLIQDRASLILNERPQFNELLNAAYMEKQSMGFHTDNEKGLGPIVSSLSMGSSAIMRFRSAEDKKVVLNLILRHGDVVVMEGSGVQEYYEHTVIPQGFRIAITARLIGEENSLAGAWR